MEYKVLGDYINLVDLRNRELGITNLLGVSIEKRFIPSIANIVGTDLSSYKVVKNGQFAYGPVTSRNGEKISIALLNGEDCIISSSYTVFEVTRKDELDPEYLMLWFSRPEFDRYARCRSHGSVREIFGWDEMCAVELPVPDIEKQRKIVKAYKTITDRIVLKQRINDNLEKSLSQVLNTTTNSVNPQKLQNEGVWHYSIPAFDSERLPVFDDPQTILSNKYVVPRNSVLVSKLNPETKRIWMTSDKFDNAICSTEFIIYIPNNPEHRDFYYLLFNTPEFIDFLVSNATGSTNSRMRVKPASTLDFSFFMPQNVSVLDDFCKMVHPILDTLEKNLFEIRNLHNLTPIAVAKMMSSSR